MQQSPPSHTTRPLLAGLMLAGLAGVPQLDAQIYTLPFNPDEGTSGADNGSPISATYGTVPGRVAVTNQAHSTYGNNPFVGDPALCYWHDDYGDLTGIAYTCSASAGVSEFAFRPMAGYGVFLESLAVGEYLGRVAGDATVKVFSWDYSTELFSQSMALDASGHWDIAFTNLSSTEGLRVQYGDNWDYGADNITVRIERINTTPEPVSMALLGTGLLGLGALRWRRRKEEGLG